MGRDFKGDDITLIKNKYGKCEYDFENDSLGSYVHIYNLFVLPIHRRQGKAKELLQMVIEAIRKTGYKDKIQVVAVPTGNSISKGNLISFYENIGLEVFECYIGGKDEEESRFIQRL